MRKLVEYDNNFCGLPSCFGRFCVCLVVGGVNSRSGQNWLKSGGNKHRLLIDYKQQYILLYYSYKFCFLPLKLGPSLCLLLPKIPQWKNNSGMFLFYCLSSKLQLFINQWLLMHTAHDYKVSFLLLDMVFKISAKLKHFFYREGMEYTYE